MSDEPLDVAVDDAVAWCQEWQRHHRVPGMAVVVTDIDETLRVELSGTADRSTARPLAGDQRWQIGSVSKAMCAIAVLQLEADGLLEVTDAVVDHLPWAERLRPDVTLHHLMTHTGGLPLGSEWTLDSRLESAAQGTVGDPRCPGLGYHYSNSGYELLGDVVEAVGGAPIEHYLERRVLAALGMTASSGSIRPQDRARDVQGHRPPRDDVLWDESEEQVPDVWVASCTADGSVVATPEDMARYLRLLIRGAADGVVDAEAFSRLSGRHVPVDATSWYGYGLMTTEVGGRVVIGHGGSMLGQFADVRVDRRLGLGTCLLVNGHADVRAANQYLLDRVCRAADPALQPAEPEQVVAPAWTDDPTGRPEWAPFVGLYRSYNPWFPTIRVLRAQDDRLLWVDPTSGSAEVLLPVAGAATRFRPGSSHSPEVVDFDVLVGGRYLALDWSGSRYGRARRDPGAATGTG